MSSKAPRTRAEAAMLAADVSQSEMARRLGVTQGAVQQIASGETKNSRLLPDIARELGVSLDWLKGITDDPAVAPGIGEDGMGVTRIRQLDIGYAMGAGTYLDENAVETSWVNFDSSWLSHISASSPDMLFVARGVGDSMNPTLHDSDLLIVDRGRRRIDQQDRIWAVAYGELGMIKRVRRLPSGRFLMISDNPTIENFEATDEELFVIGRVAWAGRTL